MRRCWFLTSVLGSAPKAQLWLRDLTPEDEEHFLASHPELEQEWHRRMEAGEPVGRRGTGPIDAERPYHHPTFGHRSSPLAPSAPLPGRD